MKLDISIILGVGTLLLAGCGSPATQEQAEAPQASNRIRLTEQQQKNAGTVLGHPSRRPISSRLKVSGRIDVPPQNMVFVSAMLGGYLKSTTLLPGMHVRRGEVIAVMEDPQYIQLQQDYLTAVARLAFIEGDYGRQKALNASKASSDKLFQQSESDYRSQKVLVRALQEKLKLIGVDPLKLSDGNLSRSVNITAPIDGFVSAVHVNIGKYVAPSEVMFELVNPSDIHLALTVYERDLGKLYIGQKVEAYTNHEPQERHACEVILVSQNLNADRSAGIHCHFLNYDKSLVPGMYMNADIEVKTDTALVLPEEALLLFEGKQYVFRQQEAGVYELLPVQTGNSEGGYTEIVSGDLRLSDQVLVKGAYAALMALKNRAEEGQDVNN